MELGLKLTERPSRARVRNKSTNSPLLALILRYYRSH